MIVGPTLTSIVWSMQKGSLCPYITINGDLDTPKCLPLVIDRVDNRQRYALSNTTIAQIYQRYQQWILEAGPIDRHFNPR